MTLPLFGVSPTLADSAAIVTALTNDDQAGFASGLVAAGTNQATALQLAQSAPLVEFNTVASGTGAQLPPAVPGARMWIFNNGANALSVYGDKAADTINNVTTAFSIAVQTAHHFFCAKSGSWGAV